LSDPIDPWSSVRSMGLFLHRFLELSVNEVVRVV